MVVRRRIELNGQWEFAPDPQQQLTAATLDVGGPLRTIQVPGPWQAQFDDLRDYSGVAWYRLRFEVTPSYASAMGGGGAVDILHFGAVDYSAAVWLNGEAAGDHEGGYLPFELDV